MAYIKDVQVGSDVYLIEPALYVAPTLSGSTYSASLANFALVTGATVQAKFASTNPANATLNVNSTGAKDIFYNGAKVTASLFKANHVYTLTYDGTQWQLVGDIDTNTQSNYGNITTGGLLSTASQAVVTDSNKKITTADLSVTDPTAATTTSNTFIDTISQNAQGKITATKKTLPTLTNVSYTAASDANEYPILMKNSTGATTTAAGTKFNSGVTINPSEKTITAGEFKGNLNIKNLTPISTKTYTTALYTSAGANYYQTFISVMPNDYNGIWVVRYKMYITASGHSDYTAVYDASISGRANTYYSYRYYNSLVNYPIHQHMYLRSSSATTPHELGVRIASSYGADSVQKVIKVELLEQDNCTATLMDSLKLYTSATPSGYAGWSGFNATSNGLQETSDANDTGIYIYSNGFKGKAGTNKVYRYCLFARTGDGTYESFVMQSNTRATTKGANPHGFVPDGKIYWNSGGSDYSAGTLNISAYEQYHVIDYLYSFNFDNQYLKDYCETYVVYTYNESDGLLYLDQTQWLAAALPTTADGKIYQRIGSKYYTGTSNYYQGSLLLNNPYYEYKDGHIRSWVPPTKSIEDTYIKKSGDTMTGNLILNAASGDSPSILFTRNGSLTDWRIVDTAGKLSFQSGTDASTWTERAYFKDNSGDFVATSFSGNGSALTNLDASKISSGTLALARLGTQAVNTVLAGPSSGSTAAAPTFRALVAADIPALSYLPLAGGVMTGNIRRYYSAASTSPMLTLTSKNQDIQFFSIGHGAAAAENATQNYYKLLYKGTNSSTNNYLQLIAAASTSAEKIAIQVDELGKVVLPQMATGSAKTPIYINSNGVITAGDALKDLAYISKGTGSTKFLREDGTWQTALTSHQTYTAFTGKPTGNQTPGFGGTFTIQQISQSATGQVSGTDRTITIPNTAASATTAGLVTTGAQVFAGNKTFKTTTRIYPFVTTQEKSAWYKITFPYASATTESAAKWFMNSFDLHFGGGYSANPSGVAHITFYWTRAASNGAWTLGQGAARVDGILSNKIIFYYRVAEPGILYVCNSANAYNGIWIDNLYVDDTAPTLDWSTTKIEAIAAITASTDPALSAYTVLPTTYTYTDGSTFTIGSVTKITNTTASTTTATGALQVAGGAGIGGRVTAQEFNATRAMVINAGKVYSNITGSNVLLPAKTSTLYANGLAIANPGLASANDVGWIRVTGTTESDMILEIATGDDGGTGEAIVARQYNTSNAVARQATLLSTTGATIFPVSMTAPLIWAQNTANNTAGLVIGIESQSYKFGWHMGSGGTNHGLYDWRKNGTGSAAWILLADASNNWTFNGKVAWSNITEKTDYTTRWPKWNEIAAGADGLSEGTSNWTDNTEILTSYASNNGFADTNAKGVVYRRDAICAYNYIKGKLDSVYVAKTAGVTNVAWDSTNKKLTKTINGSTTDVVTVATLKSAINVTAADLGLSNAMHFIGIATVTITDGSTTDPTISGYTFGTNGASAQAGDVIIDKDSAYEYVWTTAKKWERLGPDGSYKTVQNAVSTATAETTAATTFVHSVAQDANGVITVKTRPLDTSGTWSGAATSLVNNPTITASGSSGTTMNASTWYTLTVGRKTVTFKTPPDTNTDHYPSAWCDTAATTAAKAAVCTDYTLTANTWLHVLIKNANSYNGKITLNVNTKGAKDIWINGTVSSSSNKTLPAGTYLVYYDGTAYHFRTDGLLPGNISGNAATATALTAAPTLQQTGTSTVNLAASTVYTLTVGGQSIAFKTTPNTTYSNFVKSGTGAAAGLVPSPGTTAGTTKFLREDGTWQVPAYTTNTDAKLQIAAVTSGTTYYPIVAANSTSAATRQYDATGFAYLGTNGTTSAVGTAKITLGNSTASGTANNKQGSIGLYGSTAYLTTIISGAPTAANTLTLPTATGTLALTSQLPGAVSKTASGLCPQLPNETTTTKFLRQDGTWQVPAYIANAAYGNITTAGAITSTEAIANGDRIVIVNNSDSSKLTGSTITFDGSTATKALTQKGTWETFNNYSLPLAASGTRGGIQIGYTQSGQNYPVQLSNEKAYVNVPWTNTNNAATHTLKTTTKYFVTGTESATTSTGGDTFDTGVYVTDTAGQLNATTFKVNEQVTLQWSSTTSSLDFVFT